VTFRSDILSDHCKFEVTLHVTGTRTNHRSPDRPVAPTDVETHINTFVATAGGRTFTWTQSGATVTRIEPDGTVVEQISGHAPVHFDGVQRTNLNTGEIIFKSSK